jgi:hypothetical protein
VLKKAIGNDTCPSISFTTFELSADNYQIIEDNIDDLQLPSIAVGLDVSEAAKTPCMFFNCQEQIKLRT